MNDLVSRVNKYAVGAGRTQEAQYLGAKQDERNAHWIGWTSAVLSTVVGTSIFAQWTQKNPVLFGLAAILAASLTALQRTAGLAERADSHRFIGAEYGRLRRRADMLRLKIEGKDLPRDAAIARLEELGEAMSTLAKEARVLPLSIYERGKRDFDHSHPEYFTAQTE